MKIGFIAEPYEEKNASGMGYVVLELMKEFFAADKENEYLIYSSKPVKKERLVENSRNIIIPGNFIFKNLWFFKNIKNYKLMPDVLIFNVPLLPLIIPSRIKTLLICHELASQKIKPRGLRANLLAFLRDRILMPFSLNRAGIIVTVSNATKTDLLKFYGVKNKDIQVIYDGFRDLTVFEGEEKQIDKEMTPYFLSVGKVKYRKNFHGITDAFIKFKKNNKSDCKLVIAGSYGGEYYGGIAEKIKASGLSDQIIFLGYIDDKYLYSLYKNAAACVFPSLNEGFGMPIIEAMSLGTPVVTSNISSMAEVAGGAALLVDPFDIDDIAGAMEKVFFDSNLREALVQKGLERAKSFSWQKSAKEYLDLIKSLTR